MAYRPSRLGVELNCSDNGKKRLTALERKEGRKKNVSGDAGAEIKESSKMGQTFEEFIIRCVLEDSLSIPLLCFCPDL